jgi:hypothetical protein
MRIIDSHVHIGRNRQTKYYSENELWRDLKEADAHGAAIFAFPEDIYRITDSSESRLRANEYVLAVAGKCVDIFPFYFVWNDFIIPENLDSYVGVKWHRHRDEPRYDYGDPRCASFLRKIKGLGMPVLLEEEFDETERFINANPELEIIIPHIGALNGGHDRMKAFYDKENVYFDTSVAPIGVIKGCLEAVGSERIIFGSDVSGTTMPFYNFPKVELEKIRVLDLTKGDLELILSGNIDKILAKES